MIGRGRPSIALAAGCGLLLAACQTLGPKPVTTVVIPPGPPAAEQPGPVAPQPAPSPAAMPATPAKARCVPRTLSKPPKYPDTDAALRDAGGAADRYQLMAAGRILRDRRLAELEKVVEGCR